MRFREHTGLWLGWGIILLWTFSTLALLNAGSLPVWFMVPLVLVQTHLYTGLFITAHDAMHGTVSRNPFWNKTTGRLAAFLFAFNRYDALLPKHQAHHHFVATSRDPDYHPGGFLSWYFSFLKEYISLVQIMAMAITFNILKFIFPAENVILYWMLPSVLSTLQLFYFGTYVPHKGLQNADDPWKARSQKKNHLLAFLSCYFFGYHREHHQKPGTPWWRLYSER